MGNYLRPRRGKKATAEAQLTQANPLKRGEIFFEVPDDGIGTGAGKIKMGDGSTGYSDLPYFLESGSGGGGGIGEDVTLTLLVANWIQETISGTQYWTNTVTCAGASTSTVPVIVPIYSTDAEMNAYSNIIQADAGTNNIKFVALEKPTVALTVVAKFAVESTADLENLNAMVQDVVDGFFTGTTAEVTAAMAQGQIANGAIVNITDDYDSLTGSNVSYNNTGTSLSATNVQDAITELNNDLHKGSVEVTADGVKSNSQLFNALYALVDTSKVSKDTVLYYGEHTIYHIIIDSPLSFSVAFVDATNGETVSMVTVNSTGSTMYIGRNGTRVDNSSTVPASGYKIKLVY